MMCLLRPSDLDLRELEIICVCPHLPARVVRLVDDVPILRIPQHAAGHEEMDGSLPSVFVLDAGMRRELLVGQHYVSPFPTTVPRDEKFSKRLRNRNRNTIATEEGFVELVFNIRYDIEEDGRIIADCDHRTHGYFAQYGVDYVVAKKNLMASIFTWLTAMMKEDGILDNPTAVRFVDEKKE